MVDFAWEWLMRCHVPDGESVVGRPSRYSTKHGSVGRAERCWQGS